MLSSELSLLCVFLFSLFCLKNNKFEKYLTVLLIMSSVMVFLDDKNVSYEQYLSLKNNTLVRFLLVLIASVFVYINKQLVPKIHIIFLLNCVNILLVSDNIFSLVLSEEFAVCSTYLLIDEKKSLQDFTKTKYFKYNVLACSMMMFFACVVIANTDAVILEDIKFEFIILKNDLVKTLLIIVPMILAFLMRIGFFLEYLHEVIGRISYERVAPICCLLIPVNCMLLYRLTHNVFYHDFCCDILMLIACVSMCYIGIRFYLSKKICELLSSMVSFFSCTALLSCSLIHQCDFQSMSILCISYILSISGVFVLLLSIRKKFNHLLNNIEDFFSIGYRHKNVGIAFSLLFLCFACMPPSLNFWKNFSLYFNMIEQHVFVGVLIVTISFILIAIKSIHIISHVWTRNDDVFFNVVNQKLISVVYVVIIIDVIVLPIVLGVFLCNYG